MERILLVRTLASKESLTCSKEFFLTRRQSGLVCTWLDKIEISIFASKESLTRSKELFLTRRQSGLVCTWLDKNP